LFPRPSTNVDLDLDQTRRTLARTTSFHRRTYILYIVCVPRRPLRHVPFYSLSPPPGSANCDWMALNRRGLSRIKVRSVNQVTKREKRQGVSGNIWHSRLSFPPTLYISTKDNLHQPMPPRLNYRSEESAVLTSLSSIRSTPSFSATISTRSR
jgi:hypothetical protein